MSGRLERYASEAVIINSWILRDGVHANMHIGVLCHHWISGSVLVRRTYVYFFFLQEHRIQPDVAERYLITGYSAAIGEGLSRHAVLFQELWWIHGYDEIEKQWSTVLAMFLA